MNDLITWDLAEEPESDALPCKGLFFRCRVSMFCASTTGAYTHTVKFLPLKKMSCDGSCDGKCSWMHEHITESDGVFTYEEPEDFGIYRLEITERYYDRESGCTEVEALGFVRVETSETNP